MAVIGRRVDAGFHTETRSTSTGALMMGTSADWFFRMVTGSVSRYSNRSPSSRAWTLALTSSIVRDVATSTDSYQGAGGGGASATPPTAPPATPPTTLPATRAGAISLRAADPSAPALAASPFSSIIASCVCGVVCTLEGSGTTGRRE